MTVLAQGQPVSCTSYDLVFVSCDKKSLKLSLYSSYLLDLVVRNDPRQKEFLAVLWVLVECQLYLVTYGFHRTYQQTVDNHDAVTVGGLRQGTKSIRVVKPQFSAAFPEAGRRNDLTSWRSRRITRLHRYDPY